jgi:uncharacterized membrane protein YdjX (TVP38/TMEM64 family)
MTGDVPASPRTSWRRLIPLGLLLSGFALFFVLGLHRYVSLEAVAGHRQELQAWVDAHAVLAPLACIAGYAAAVALFLPGGVVLSITSGFLLGTVHGAICAIIGATLGAMIVFFAARTAFGDILRRRAGPALRRMEDGFVRDAFSYLLVLRLLPIFPFFLVNAVPALLGVRAQVFVAATLLGLTPGAFVFAGVGNGVGDLFDAGRVPDLEFWLTPSILLPLLGLAVLALIPVVYRRVKERVQ